jgi:glycosyltransferase involved in cell wall biosynthesis
MKTKYTVLVCTHNRAQVLPRTLDALDKLNAQTGVQWEIIVVDNASSDGTERIVQEFVARSKVPARYIREERMGHAIAMNTGISASQGEIIAHTDDDAMPCSDWLTRLDEAFATHDAEIVFGPVRPAWESGPPPWFSARFPGFFALLDYGDVPFLVADADHPFFGVNHACRKSVYRDLGDYREDLGPYGRRSRGGSDSEFFLRALERGVRIAYQPTAVVEHIIPASRSKKSDLRHRIWQNRVNEYRNLFDDYASNPWLLGLPRWYFAEAIKNAMNYAWSICRRDPSESFFYELRLYRFLVQLFQASLHGFGIKTPTVQAQVDQVVLNPAHGLQARDSSLSARV